MVPSHSPTVDLAAVTAAMAAVEPAPMRLVLFGSRARGEARPDSDIDLLVALRALREGQELHAAG